MPPGRGDLTWGGVHSTLRIQRPAPGVVFIAMTGTELGEHGDELFAELTKDAAAGTFELFVDARHSHGIGVEVGSKWARWLATHRASLREVHMLAVSRLVQLTAKFVRNFAALQPTVRIYDDAEAFDGVLARAVSAVTE
jgi:hypothetical protein